MHGCVTRQTCRLHVTLLGMGVGAGGYVLAAHSIQYPDSVFGLILLSPAVRCASWWELSFGMAIHWYLNLRGIERLVTEHFVQRLTSGRSSDLTHNLKQAIQGMSRCGLMDYFNATLSRPDLISKIGGLKVKRLLLLWGYESIYKHDSRELNRHFPSKERIGWAEIDECGTLLTEECPFRILEEMKLYIQALQTQGYFQEWKLD